MRLEFQCPGLNLRIKFTMWLCLLRSAAGVDGEMDHASSLLSVTAPHLYYICPEGGTAKMVCDQSGAATHSVDVVKHSWLFNPHSDQHCHGNLGPRNTVLSKHSHVNHSSTPGVHYEVGKHKFWLILQNLTPLDQGRYCCVILDYQVINKHASLLQKPHSHVLLQVTPRRNGSQTCTVLDPKPPESSVSAVLATVACIFALLSLPLILVLVYKQRQNAESSRRAHELVRMDSEAQGHENPLYLQGSPQTKTRTVSQIMTRQSSETGCHLLSDPGTPLTPIGLGDVFFPAQEPIPESPDFLQV